MATCVFKLKIYLLPKTNKNVPFIKEYERNFDQDACIDDVKELYKIEIHPELQNLCTLYFIDKIEVEKIQGTNIKIIGTFSVTDNEKEPYIPPSVLSYQDINNEFTKLENATEEQRNCMFDIIKTIKDKSNVKLILDTNIFLMSPKFIEMLVIVIGKYESKIYIVADTFDEICIKKDKSEYGTILAKNARLSLRLIEKMKRDNLIIIEGDIDKQYSRNIYADPKIIEWVENNIKDTFIIAIINDTELRIRLGERMKNYQNIRIIELNEKTWLQ